MKKIWQNFVEGKVALRVERDVFDLFALDCENCNILYRGGGVHVPTLNPFRLYTKKYILFYCVNPGYTAPWCKLVYTDAAGLKAKYPGVPIEDYIPFPIIKEDSNETLSTSG